MRSRSASARLLGRKPLSILVATIITVPFASLAFAQPAPVTDPAPTDPNAPAPTTTTTPAATATGPVTAVGDDDDDLSMTFHAKRTGDMQQFAEQSLQELRVGSIKSRYSLNLFGDFEIGARSRSEGALKPQPAFALGVFDMLFNADLEQKIFLTAESTFGYGSGGGFADLERLHLRWKPNKYFFVEAGRFHTDLGYWNVAYHHGKWLQLSIERPRVIALHGGLLPVHWLGAQSGISIPVAKGNINIIGSFGSAHDPLAQGHGGGHGANFTPMNAVHGKIESAGIGLADLRVGVAGVYSKIPEETAFVRPGLPDEKIGEYVGNAFIAYPSVPLILISEGYVIQHKSIDFTWRTYAFFAMIGYQVGRFTPFLKGEYITQQTNADTPDPFYIPEPKSIVPPVLARELVEATMGLRIDTSTWSSLKLEYRMTRRGDLDLFRPSGNPLPLIHAGVINWGFGI